MDPQIVSSLITLGAVVLGVGAVAVIALVIRRKTREISRMAFGTDNLMEGLQKAEAEYESTPKSLSSMTSLALERIKRDFPEFNYDDMKARASNVIVSYLRCIDENNANLLTEGNAELKRELKLRLEMLRNVEHVEQYDRIKVHRLEISSYVKRNGRCIVTFQCALQSKHVLQDQAGETLKGDTEKWEQSRWETDLVYIQDPDKLTSPELAALGLNCPNCGAPITNLGNKSCEYCGTAITEINLNAWTFNAVREA
ncbi:MAG: hypothetical protein Q4E12_07300 [Coriobacteriia bacterium]|nr:hypothetical protein [Coriobacteriia bacterium]